MPGGTCSKCGGQMRQTEKYTDTGVDIRTYTCEACGASEDVSLGPALWQVLADDQELTEACEAIRHRLPILQTGGTIAGLVGRLRASEPEVLKAVFKVLLQAASTKEIDAASTLLKQAGGQPAARLAAQLLPRVTGYRAQALRRLVQTQGG